jgi:hypothetical protein
MASKASINSLPLGRRGDKKMKRVQIFVLGLLIAAFAIQGTSFAKLVSGKVDSVDGTGNKLTITSTNVSTGAEEKSDIWVKSDATFSGVQALNELKNGDEVWVEADQNGEKWEASKVTKA